MEKFAHKIGPFQNVTYQWIARWLAVALMLAMTVSVAAQSVELRLKDGSKWRGRINDTVEISFLMQGVEVPMAGTLTKAEQLYIVVDGEIGGIRREMTIFRADIVSMKTIEGGRTTDTGATPIPGNLPSTPTTKPGQDSKEAARGDQSVGVFVLPLGGMVGEGFRHQEIEAIGKEADKYGRGQIIVFLIESGGGLAAEMDPIHATLKELKKRHRVVAWIKEAISAAAATAINCDEIYFMPEGTLGAMTMFAGDKSAEGILLETWMETAGDYMESGGRHRYIAYAMIDEKALLSYDKDPVTGEVTWYDDLSGAHDLSDDQTNLVFTATVAEHCGFSDGTANTQEDLAKLLNLPRWHEISDYGRKIASEWLANVERANREIPMLKARYDYKGTGSGDATVVLGTRISIINNMIRWWDRCPNVAQFQLPPKEELQREAEELRKQLADMRRGQRQ